jgi:Leucine Rich repeat
LTECNNTLTRLYWGHNANISEIIHLAARAFVDANQAGIRLLHSQAKLDLSSKGINAIQAKRVAAELSVNTTVTTLALNQNTIGHLGCIDIADSLMKNCTLTSIELDGNLIGDHGCAVMAAMLFHNTILTKISLNGNGIGPAGAIALAETLRINASLRELELGGNYIGNEGAAAVAGALRHNEMLKQLGLCWNSISDEGAVAILTTLMESNFSLAWLNLRGNAKISSGLQKDIGFVVRSRQVLKSFCKCLCKPLDEKLMPLVIHRVQLTSIFHVNLELMHCQERTAGPIFLLVRATALQDSKFIKVAPPSCRGSKTRDM